MHSSIGNPRDENNVTGLGRSHRRLDGGMILTQRAVT